MIYLDHNATSPMRPEVRDAILPWLGVPANPASAHWYGQRARMAVERAREDIAALVGGNPAGVVLTSGATEANHLYVRGVVRSSDRGALALSAIEHPCVRAAAEASGADVIVLPVGPDGVVRIVGLTTAVAAVSIMAANHETGVIQPIADARAAANAVGAALHVDATQAAGRIPLALGDVDGVVLSSHKIGGPSGVGALILRDGEPFPPLLSGGGQERGRRAGTVNVAGVVGFAAACRLALAELDARSAALTELSERLRAGVTAAGGRVVGVNLLPNTTCAVFPGIAGEAMVQALDLRGFAVSAGAACASGSAEPSPVLRAMGDPEPAGVVRFSLGWSTAEGDIDAVLAVLPEVVASARAADAW